MSRELKRKTQVAEAEGVTFAEVVLRAVDAYLADSHVDANAALRATFGADPQASATSRDKWNGG